jgi:hydrogenase 3 maturation protease
VRHIIVYSLEVNLKKILCNGKIVIACIGSPLRSDDRIGLLIFDRLSKIPELKSDPRIKLLKCEYGLENCLTDIIRSGADKLLLIDAVYNKDLEPGEIVLVDGKHIVEKTIIATTHNIPVTITLSIIEKNSSINEIYLLGIRVLNTEIGLNISEQVLSASNKVIELIRSVLSKCSN